MGITTATEGQTPADPLQGWADGLTGFGHPIRIRALALFEAEHSPNMLCDALGDVPLGVISYHVRMLRQYGLVELERTEPKRGALEHFYTRSELGDMLMGKVAPLVGIPPARPGQAGTEKRMAALYEWAHREPADADEDAA